MNDTHDIETKIEAAHAPLSSDARERMWAHIEAQIAKKHAVLSPYVFMSHITHVRALVPVTLALIVIVGLGGTAWASESARPGDALFPVDRAIETLRLSVARDDASRVALTHTFTDERLAELKALIDDSSLSDDTIRTERIDEAVALTLALIDEAGVADDARIADLANELRDANVEVRNDRIRARWDDGRFEVRRDDDDGDDDDERIEYRGDDGERIRIEEKDGEVRIKSSSGHGSDDGDDIFDDSSSRSGSDDDGDDDSRHSSSDDSFDDSDTSSRSSSDDSSDSSDDSDDRDDSSSGKGSGKDSEDDSNDDSNDDSSGSGNSGKGSGKNSDDD